MTHRATPNVRHNTAQTLVEADGLPAKEADAWANSTADAATEIRLWRAAKFTPAQAQVIYAAADHEPADWRDLELPVDLTVAYVEAGFPFDEVLQLEDTGDRPDQEKFDFMRATNRPKIEAAIKKFKAALRDDSEIADLDEDW